MAKKKPEFLNLHECIVRDERGLALAVLYEDMNGVIVVKKTTACSVGTYLYIIGYIRDLGFEAR